MLFLKAMTEEIDMGNFENYVHKDLIRREWKQSKVYHYLDRYIDDATYSVADLEGRENVKYNQTIWILWMQGMEHAPKLVQKCFDSICRNKPDGFDVVVLSNENLEEYIHLPQYIIEKYAKVYITTAMLSDIIRLELLCTYGGVWIDATVFCSGRIPDYMVSDMFLFKGSMMDSTVIKMSSWWLCADRRNRIVHATRNVLLSFWEKENDSYDYFLFHIAMSKLIDENSGFNAIYWGIPYFNNGNPHVLQGKLDKGFDEREWEIIKDASVVHKLTHKKRYLRGDIYNYYQALVDDKLR